MKTVLKISCIAFFYSLTNMGYAQNSLTLEQCIALALKNNTLIKNSTIEIEASRQIKKGVFTKYFPSISATGMAIKFNKPLIKYDMPGGDLPVYDGNPAHLQTATEFAYFPGISLSLLDKLTFGSVMATQPIFVGGRIYYGNKLASLGMDVSNKKLTMTKNEVILKTEEQYWLMVSLNEKMKTIKMYNRLLDTLYKDVSNAYQSGLVTHNDVLKVSIKMNELQMKKLQLENGKKLALMSFCQNIGIVYDSLLTFSDSATSNILILNTRVNFKQALSNRIEYQLVQVGVKAETLQSKIKRGEYLPQVAVGVGAFTFNMNDSWNNNTVAFGSISIPISSWWEASHTLKERNLKEQIAQNNAQNTSELLMLQMEKAWGDLQEVVQQIQLAENAIQQSEENLKISNDNYHAGIVGISDLLEAQAILQTSYDKLTETQCSYHVKMSIYLQVTGTDK